MLQSQLLRVASLVACLLVAFPGQSPAQEPIPLPIVEGPTLFGWGWNGSGSLGTGVNEHYYPSPTLVRGALTGKPIFPVAVGPYDSCAITIGDLYCCGS